MSDGEDIDDHLDATEQSLGQTLTRLRSDIDKILDGSVGLIGPDSALDALDARAGELCRNIEQLDATIERLEQAADADLNALADAAVVRHLDEVGFPVVVSSAWDVDLPVVARPSDSVYSALDRIVRQSLEFAQAGGEVRLRSRREGRDAVLIVAASRMTLDTPLAECLTRLGTSVDFVDALGGRLTIEVSDDEHVLHLALWLPLTVEAVDDTHH